MPYIFSTIINLYVIKWPYRHTSPLTTNENVLHIYFCCRRKSKIGRVCIYQSTSFILIKGRFAVGQNIARTWTTQTPSGPYDSEPRWRHQIFNWFNEVQHYRTGYSSTTGHYTQVRSCTKASHVLSDME